MKSREETALTRLQIIAKLEEMPPRRIDNLIEELSASRETGAEFYGEFFGGPQIDRILDLLRLLRDSSLDSVSIKIAEEIITRPTNVYAVWAVGGTRPARLCQVIEAPEGVDSRLVLARWLHANGLPSEAPGFQIDFCPVSSWQSLVEAGKPFTSTVAYYAKK